MPRPDLTVDGAVNLTDPTLFGNESAEDEREDVFISYAFERPEVDAFSDGNNRLGFARAYKGEGKSALLRLTERRIRKTVPAPIAEQI